MNYNYEPLFNASRGIAFPPLKPERWSNYPTAQQLYNTDALFYQSRDFDPNEKSDQFRKAVVADWAGNQLANNYLYFNNYPIMENNAVVDENTSRQIRYVTELGFGDDTMNPKSKNYIQTDTVLDDLERAAEKIVTPYRTPQELIQHLIVPHTAGVEVSENDLPSSRDWFEENFVEPERKLLKEWRKKYEDMNPLQRFVVRRQGMLPVYVDEQKEKDLERRSQAVKEPKYFGQAYKSIKPYVSFPDVIIPNKAQEPLIEIYRKAIDKLSGIKEEGE